MGEEIMLFLFLITLPQAKGAQPGTFFWKPRLSLGRGVPTTEISMSVNSPTKENIAEGLVVMVNGYAAGLTVIGRMDNPHLNPMSAYYFTNVYRWALRYMSLIPDWLRGRSGNFVETHKTWKRRYYYMDKFMPSWMKKMVPFIKKEEWEKEELDYKRFKKYAEPAFSKSYKFPSKSFNNFKSQLMTTETMDVVDQSSTSN